MPPLGGNAPMFPHGARAAGGETRSLRYDNQRDNMANVLFPGEQSASAAPHNPHHRNVTSSNHPFLGDRGSAADQPATGRRPVRGRADTADLLAGPSDDAPQQKLVGVSSLRARGLGPGPQRDVPMSAPEAGPVAGQHSRREGNMGSLLFGGADASAQSQPTSARGKRRGPVDYSQYQLRMPAPSAAAAAAPAPRAHSVGPPSSVGVRDGVGSIGGAHAHARAPPPAAVPDALDQHMHGDAHVQELAAKHAAIAREVRALPRDKDGMIGEISQVADALRKQGLLMSVAGFSELLARCDVDPSGFPNFDDFMGCLMREDGQGAAPKPAPEVARPAPSQPADDAELARAELGARPRFHMPSYDEPEHVHAHPSAAAQPPMPPEREAYEQAARAAALQRGSSPPRAPSAGHRHAPAPGSHAQNGGPPTDALERMRIDGGGLPQNGLPEARFAPPPQQPQQQPRASAPYAQHDEDDGVVMRRVPGSRAPIESKSAMWATSANSYGRYLSAVPAQEINAHIGRNQKPSNFTRHEPKREANSGFAY